MSQSNSVELPNVNRSINEITSIPLSVISNYLDFPHWPLNLLTTANEVGAAGVRGFVLHYMNVVQIH